MNTTQAIVSIIVPVYKVEETLLRGCIESLMAQTLEEIEILLVDDGCPVGCGEICEEYARTDGRIRVIHRPNGGLSAARNTGMDAASGQYLVFVDGDDFVEPDCVQRLYEAAERSGADITACGADRYHTKKGSYSPYYPGQEVLLQTADEIRGLRLSLLRSVKLRLDELYLPVNNCAWAHMYRTKALQGLRFDTRLKGGEDRLFNYHALGMCRMFCGVPGVYYHYVINSDSLTQRFHADAPSGAMETYRIYRALPEVERDKEFRNTYFIRTCCMVVSQAPSHFLHPANPTENKQRAFRAFCREDVVAEAIRKADLRPMRLSKMKLVIYCLKLGLYGPAMRLARRFGL